MRGWERGHPVGTGTVMAAIADVVLRSTRNTCIAIDRDRSGNGHRAVLAWNLKFFWINEHFTFFLSFCLNLE